MPRPGTLRINTLDTHTHTYTKKKPVGQQRERRGPVNYIHLKRKSKKGIKVREGIRRQPLNLLMGTHHTALFRPTISWV